MGFRFPLATLLRLREIAEKREERLLAQILNQIAQSRQTLADLEVQRLSLCTQRETALSQSTAAFELAGCYAAMRHIEELEAVGQQQLAKLMILREQQLKVFGAAHRNTESLLSLRDDQRASFEKERVRQEQNAMDDNFSSRRRPT